MATITFYPTTTWNYKDGSVLNKGDSLWNIGRTSSGTNLYYALAEFDLASSLSGKSITSAVLHFTCYGGNSTTCPVGCGISKSSTVATCASIGNSPAGAVSVADTTTTVSHTVDITDHASVLQQSGTSYVILAQTGTTNNTYKTLYGSGNSTYRPYLVVTYTDTYTLTLSKGDYISAVSGGGNKTAGASVTVKATLASYDGYTVTFDGWYNGSTRVSNSLSYTFTMPSNALTLTAKATREANGVVRYHNGSGWVQCVPYYHNGSGWVQCVPHYHDGTGWKECGV